MIHLCRSIRTKPQEQPPDRTRWDHQGDLFFREDAKLSGPVGVKLYAVGPNAVSSGPEEDDHRLCCGLHLLLQDSFPNEVLRSLVLSGQTLADTAVIVLRMGRGRGRMKGNVSSEV